MYIVSSAVLFDAAGFEQAPLGKKSYSSYAYEEDWAYTGAKDRYKALRKADRKAAVPKAVGSVPLVNVHKDSLAAPAPGPAGPGGPGGPSPAPAPGPGPAPAPRPLTWREQMAKMKGDMTRKLGGDSFDADYVIDRPTQFPILHKEYAVGPYHDMFPDDGSLAPGPGPSPSPMPPGWPAPAPMGSIPFTESSLPDHVNHNDMVTASADFRREYGPNGPQRDPNVVHGPHIDRPWKGWR